MRYGSPFKPVDHTKLSQFVLQSLTSYTELPLGSMLFCSRGAGDYDDSYEVDLRVACKKPMWQRELTEAVWNTWFCEHDFGINWKKLSPQEEIDLLHDTMGLYCAGGEL